MTNEETIKIFEKTGGILEGHFLLTSGKHSAKYMQCAKLFVHPEDSVKLCGELAKKLKKYNAEVVISPAVGGIIMGYEMARQLNAVNIFAERIDGKMELRRGFELKPGQRVIAVEDVVTTGGSVTEVAELAKSMGAEVLAIASIVDRSNGKVRFSVPFESLLSIDVPSNDANDCPVCKKGLPLVKPGSRNIK